MTAARQTGVGNFENPGTRFDQTRARRPGVTRGAVPRPSDTVAAASLVFQVRGTHPARLMGQPSWGADFGHARTAARAGAPDECRGGGVWERAQHARLLCSNPTVFGTHAQRLGAPTAPPSPRQPHGPRCAARGYCAGVAPVTAVLAWVRHAASTAARRGAPAGRPRHACACRDRSM